MRSDFMEKIARGLANRDLLVCRFEFPYMKAGRKAPDRQEVLEDAYLRAVEAARRELNDVPLFLGGKSLGGRIASHVVGRTDAAGLFFLGYPLHPPGKPERARIDNLSAVSVPMLFVEGTRDPFCPLPALRRFLETHKGPAELAVIEGGDHSFKVPRSSDRSTERAWGEVVDEVARWVHGTVDCSRRAGDR
jgi:uncharacterized protein